MQDLVVQRVANDLREVRIDVRGVAGAVRRVTFTFDEPWQALGSADQARGWMAEGRLLTYVNGPAGGALLDDAESFRRSFGGDAGCDG